MMSGIVKMLTTLLIAVNEIESAVSPLAKWLIRLLVTPPGQAARIISPTHSSPGNPETLAMAKPISGRNKS